MYKFTIPAIAMEKLTCVKDTIVSITDTPFYKDTVSGGLFGVFSAAYKGYERENLKIKIESLQDEYKKGNINTEKALQDYDKFSKDYKCTNIVKEKRKILEKKLGEQYTQSSSNSTSDSSNDADDIFNKILASDELNDLNDIIYILKLDNNKYFIGKTNEKSFQECINLHNNGTFCSFTNINKPIRSEITETVSITSPFDEDKIVKEYMLKYGISNVRGASYNTVNLSVGQVISLQKELMYATNKKITCYQEYNLNDVNASYISTFIMSEYGKFPIEEIAQMRSLRTETIKFHLQKCRDIGMEII